MKTMRKFWWLGAMLLVCVAVAFAAVNVKGLIIDAITGYTVAGAAANNTAICGNGTVGTYQASCGIAVASASVATALATTPAQCSGGTPLATGIAANGNANCTAAPSAGTVSDHNVTSSRVLGGVYQNTSVNLMLVHGYFITAGSGEANFTAFTDTSSSPTIASWGAQYGATTGGANNGFFFSVVPGSYYKLVASGSDVGSLASWYETY